ncbi:hypothetical protein FIBSPDRAFT_604321 [Athelia psychrophila]|uniref:Uncharacterized protein n=1 Tax=Athelia psychrophila TaxID=1759441 RepID=A0A166GK35_9AGAM|nr:hypothetical protein FIBSPDRAFT_604321 [Fibularhizoctonia sp. CBS 109695]
MTCHTKHRHSSPEQTAKRIAHRHQFLAHQVMVSRWTLILLLNSAYLRQFILPSALETPDTRALFNSSRTSVAGKLHREAVERCPGARGYRAEFGESEMQRSRVS